MQIVDALLGDPAIIVGQFRERRFEPWEIPATEASARIRREWEVLGRRVNLATSAGSRSAHSIRNAIHLTNRWSQPLAAPMPNFQMTSTCTLEFALATASGGSASSR